MRNNMPLKRSSVSILVLAHSFSVNDLMRFSWPACFISFFSNSAACSAWLDVVLIERRIEERSRQVVGAITLEHRMPLIAC